MKKLVVIVAILVVAAAGFGIYTLLSGRDGLVKVEGYVDTSASGTVCTAIRPGCGVCFGEVIDGECFVKPAELSDFQKKAMGLD